MTKRGTYAVLMSGGMDSVTLGYMMLATGHRVHVVGVDYGQRHRKELLAAVGFAERAGVERTIIPAHFLRDLLPGSALTDRSIGVPRGHYTDATMKATVVPNRNMIFASIAAGMAVARGYEGVAMAVHAGDHTIYPDCRPEFVRALYEALSYATEDKCSLYTPFINYTKAQIAAIGKRLKVRYEETWSCYEGGDIHCGECGTCVERIEALDLAGVHDLTVYRHRHTTTARAPTVEMPPHLTLL